MVACHRTGEARFPRYSRGNGTFDQPSAGSWRFFTDIAMEKVPTLKQCCKFVVFPFQRTLPPTSWSKRANFVNRQRAGEAVLEGLQNWIRPNTDMQKPVNLYVGTFCDIFHDIAIENGTATRSS